MTTASPLGQRVRALRRVAGLSARELDSLAGLTTGHSAQVESTLGDRVAARTAASLAHVLGVSVEFLLEGGESPSDESVHAAVEAARASRLAPTGTE